MNFSEIEIDCRKILSTHARSFSWAALFLPKKTHNKAAIIYAFCRTVDDAVDEAANIETAKKSIDDLRQELINPTPHHGIVAAFRQINHSNSIALKAAEHLIEGVTQDITKVRIKNDTELLRYCYNVASTPGLMMCPVIGVKDSCALPFAIDLGIAMQLTNICRDIYEDAQQDRVYLPQTRLQEVGIEQSDVVSGTANPQELMQVVEGLLELAEQYYKSGSHGMHFIPFWSRCSIIVASHLYRAIGRKVKKRGTPALKSRTVMNLWEKSSQLIGACFVTLGFIVIPKFKRINHDKNLHIGLEDLPRTHFQ